MNGSRLGYQKKTAGAPATPKKAGTLERHHRGPWRRTGPWSGRRPPTPAARPTALSPPTTRHQHTHWLLPTPRARRAKLERFRAYVVFRGG